MKKRLIIALLALTCHLTAQNFADTKGELQISNSGTATYTLPIALPPSIKDLGPTISLSYASGAMGGIAGQGWHINSISNISRMATRRDIDGFVDGVDFDDNDKLGLDGQRMLLKTGVYWEDGSTYETEIKSNTRIQLFKQGVNCYFIVTAPDGSRSWYGSTGTGPNFASLTAWYIVRYEDPHGNYIAYNYENFTHTAYDLASNADHTTSQYYISSIEFSGNVTANIPLQNKIEFNYREEEPMRVERDFIKGEATYAFKILDNVRVYTVGTLFREYKLTYNADAFLGYERLTQIQEFNGNGDKANPVEFEYNSTPENSFDVAIEHPNNLNLQSVVLSGDFDGDGRTDYITDSQLYKKMFANGLDHTPVNLNFAASKRQTFTATTLSNSNTLNQWQSIVNAAETTSAVNFKVYNFNGSSVGMSYMKTVAIDNFTFHDSSADVIVFDHTNSLGPGYNHCDNHPESIKDTNSYIEGDFNGDGISEVLMGSNVNESYYFKHACNEINPLNFPCYCEPMHVNDGTDYYMIDLRQDASTTLGERGYVKLANAASLQGGENIAMDFNGDGKTDILTVYDIFKYRVTTFKELPQAPWLEAEVIGEGQFYGHTEGMPLYYGDYNGDGKIDILTPVLEPTPIWLIHYSNQGLTGTDPFFKTEIAIMPFDYEPVQHGQTWLIQHDYIPMDINRDGKTDIVQIYKKKVEQGILDYNSWDSEYQYVAYVNNIGNSADVNNLVVANFKPSFISPIYHSRLGPMPQTVVAGRREFNTNVDLIMLWNNNQTHYIGFEKNVRIDNMLKRVTEASGNIVQTIDYAEMIASEYPNTTPQDFYSEYSTVTYPNVEIKKIPGNYLVSKLTAEINGISKYQDFRYNGFVVNLGGIGAIGFNRTARSSWYITPSDQIWTVEYNNPLMRGATTTTFTTTNGGSAFEFQPTNVLSRKDNRFSVALNANKAYNILLDQQDSYDNLTGTHTNSKYNYDPDGYGLRITDITQTFSNSVLKGKTTISTQYDNNEAGAGSSYYIGRPKQVDTETIAYGDTRTSKIIYTYNGNDLVKTEKGGTNTSYYLTEEMGYDAVGNLLAKTVSAPGATGPEAVASRTITDEYEPNKRFVFKKTDHQGFVTELHYNPYGQLTQSTDPFGVISDFSYDGWGKLTETAITNKAQEVLRTRNTYDKLSDGGYTVTTDNMSGDSSQSITQYDVLGRIVRSTTKGFGAGTTISKDIVYDGLGHKVRESEPYFTSAQLWTDYEYDNLHRPTKITLPSLKVQTFAYAGLTTTTDDDGRTSTATADALGNKVQTTDDGGSVDFVYYANGQLRSSDYGGNLIQIGIDGWGRKISMRDPNAGAVPYTYAYDAFSQLLSETTPKGTTSYLYDNVGKLSRKTVSGDGADDVTNYHYNALAQLEEETTNTVAGSPIDQFLYHYDNFHRLEYTSEHNQYLDHSKGMIFDDYGRVDTEVNTTTESSGHFSSSVRSKYHYHPDNGIMYKITDENGNRRWELNSANARMQALEATLGNNVDIYNTYTDTGLFTSQYHAAANGNAVMATAYGWDERAGLLRTRDNVVLDTHEEFKYDLQERLTTWTNPATGDDVQNRYDERGRITTNGKVGDVSYNSPAEGLYRKDKIMLSPEGREYYHALHGIQTVSYTMFKTPISINESNKGKMLFEYNAHQSRMRMVYGYVPPTPHESDGYTQYKLYTDDGAAEVLYDKVANTTKIRTFIGGDAYSAVAYSEAVIDIAHGVQASEELYYLHRDYLGSVLAVTDGRGVAMEQRQFDAWGNLAVLHDSGGHNLSLQEGLKFFDRGYTSHEHLQEVHLVNMNGRLYDPVLMTFLMPDNFVQAPDNTQSYNRYAYVWNNPLKYTDPSGEELITACVIAIAVAVTMYLATNYITDQNITLAGALTTGIIAGVTAVATFGIGTAATSLFTNFYSQAAFQAVAHGVVQGGFSSATGGTFWSGFAAGALSSIAASAWSGGETSTHYEAVDRTFTTQHAGISGALGLGKSTTAMIAFGTVTGGASAELAGGNFWMGAASGFMVSYLNHAMHAMDGDGDPPGKKKALSKNETRKNTVKPSFSKFVEVEGNTLTIADALRTSEVGNFVRGGVPALPSISSGLKVAGNTLGMIGIAVEGHQYLNGEISGTEFGVDATISGAAIGTSLFFPPAAPFFAAGALIWFGGKAIYEYSYDKAVFEKP